MYIYYAKNVSKLLEYMGDKVKNEARRWFNDNEISIFIEIFLGIGEHIDLEINFSTINEFSQSNIS